MNITNILENSLKFKDRTAYKFHDKSLSFGQVYDYSYAVATKICKESEENKPIIIISNKNIFVPSVYLGIALANCYYVPLSTEMPNTKLQQIIDFVQSEVIICDDESIDNVKSLQFSGKILSINDCISQKKDEEEVNRRKENIVDSNPLYVIFTSGSTGVPKGVVTSHYSVADYVQTFADTFDIGQDEIFGNQAPLDYIAGIRDIYIPLIKGCCSVFLQKNLFSTPKLLFETLNNEKITTICWVSPALALCCQFDVFKEVKLKYVKKVFFTGSVLDYKYLNMWKDELPNALFVNHYGPTEITASCSYYIVDNSKKYDKNLPIGKAFKNRKIIVLTKDNKLAKIGEVGQICVIGNCLALGYFKNESKTSECFIQNPLNDLYREMLYKTGDLGYIGEDGNLYFTGRIDNQIKHMGHRVELGDIENLAVTCENVKECSCVYDSKKSVIILFYSGVATAGEISKFLRKSLPSFMVPRKLINLESLPKLYNGKIDRLSLKRQAGIEA